MRTREFLALPVPTSVPKAYSSIVAPLFSLLSPITAVKKRLDNG